MTSNTLLDLFRPPDGHFGHLGLLTAFCATADFLEDAASTFSRMARARRESYGKPFLFLLLDGHKTTDRVAVLKPNEVPGVFELPPRVDRHRELLHAKVGVLAFSRTRTGVPTHLRLIVTTGNWTQASARRQLELAWQLDVDVVDSTVQGSWTERADLVEAARFFELALERFATAPALRERINTLLTLARSDEPEWTTKRFIHTLKPARAGSSEGTSLYQQIAKLAPHDRDEPRDTVLCGSGFFEKPGAKTAKPDVLAHIDDLPGLKPGKRIVLVRPSDAGALARWKGDHEGWLVCAAEDAEAQTPRTLHAKFIYVGRRWGSATRDGWLYLGSGNLTKRGLLLAPNSPGRGNVEAGVILTVEDKMDAETLLSRLFVNVDDDALNLTELKAGQTDDDVLDAPLVDTPPVLLAEEVIDEHQRGLQLTWSDVAGPAVTLSWPGAQHEVARGTKLVTLSGPCPSVITVHFDGKEMLVPVVDARGRFCSVPRSAARFDDALADLLNFPVPLAEEDDVDIIEDDDNDDSDAAKAKALGPQDESLAYPLQEGMKLIEHVAALQAELSNERLLDWFEHLESRLIEGFSPEQIQAWRALELPILETLRDLAFRPPNMSGDQTKAYLTVINRVATKWSAPT